MCLDLGHKRCSALLWAHCPYCGFQNEERASSTQEKGKEADLRPFLPFAGKLQWAGWSKSKEPETDTQSCVIHLPQTENKPGSRLGTPVTVQFPTWWSEPMTKPELRSPGVWLVFSVQVCPIRLDTSLCIFPLLFQQSTLFPHAAELRYVEEILFFFPFHWITDDNWTKHN